MRLQVLDAACRITIETTDRVTSTLLVTSFWDEHVLVLRPSLFRKYSEYKRGAYAPKLQRVRSEGALAATQLGTDALNGDKTLGGERAGAASHHRRQSSSQRQTTQRN